MSYSQPDLPEETVQSTPGPMWESVSFLILIFWATIFACLKSSMKEALPAICGILVLLIAVGVVVARRNHDLDFEVWLRRTIFPSACFVTSAATILHDGTPTMCLLAWYGACSTVSLKTAEVLVGRRFSFDDGTYLPDQSYHNDLTPGEESTTMGGVISSIPLASGSDHPVSPQGGGRSRSGSLSPSSSSPSRNLSGAIVPDIPTALALPPATGNISPTAASISTIGTSVSQLDKHRQRMQQSGGGNPLMISTGNIFIALSSSDDDENDQMEPTNASNIRRGAAVGGPRALRRAARVPISIGHPGCVGVPFHKNFEKMRETCDMFIKECDALVGKGDILNPPREYLQLSAPKLTERPTLGNKSLRSRKRGGQRGRDAGKAAQLGEAPREKPRSLADLVGGSLQLPPIHSTVIFWFVVAFINHVVVGLIGPVFKLVIPAHFASVALSPTTAAIHPATSTVGPLLEIITQVLLLTAIVALLAPPVLQYTEERAVLSDIVQVYARRTYTQPHKKARVDGALCNVNILSDMAIAAGQNVGVSIVPQLEDGSTPRHVDQERRMVPGFRVGMTPQSTTCVTPMMYALSEASFMAGAEYAEGKFKRSIREGGVNPSAAKQPGGGGGNTGSSSSKTRRQLPPRSGNTTVVSASTVNSSGARGGSRVQSAWGDSSSNRSGPGSGSGAFQSGSFRAGRTVAASSTSPALRSQVSSQSGSLRGNPMPRLRNDSESDDEVEADTLMVSASSPSGVGSEY